MEELASPDEGTRMEEIASTDGETRMEELASPDEGVLRMEELVLTDEGVLRMEELASPDEETRMEDKYKLAQKLYDKTQYDQALTIFTELAEQGHAKSQYMVALCYDTGNGVNRDCDPSHK